MAEPSAHVTLPMLTPTIFFNLVLSIIATFQTFTSAFVATNGGPLDSTLFFVLYLYRKAFQEFQMGYASALAWVLFLIILVLDDPGRAQRPVVGLLRGREALMHAGTLAQLRIWRPPSSGAWPFSFSSPFSG